MLAEYWSLDKSFTSTHFLDINFDADESVNNLGIDSVSFNSSLMIITCLTFLLFFLVEQLFLHKVFFHNFIVERLSYFISNAISKNLTVASAALWITFLEAFIPVFSSIQHFFHTYTIKISKITKVILF